MLEAELVVLEGHLRGTTFPLGVRAVVGRAIGCEIQLVHDGISRRHCEVVVRDEGATVEDLGSTNGTKLNGERVSHAPLYHGDKVEVGPVVLQFQCLGARNPQDTGAELAPDLQPGGEPVALSASRLIALPGPGEPGGRLGDGGPTLPEFYELAHFLVERRDTVSLATGLVERLRRLFAPDRIVLFDYDQAVDRIQAVQVLRGKFDPPGSTVPVPEKVVAKCLRESKAIVAGIEDEGGSRTVLCAPLKVDARTIGAVYLDRPLKHARAYGPEDVSALAAAGGLAAYAIDRIQFEREARARALELERRLATVEVLRDAYRGGFEKAQEPLVALDEEGSVLAANPAAAPLLEELSRRGKPTLAEAIAPVLADGQASCRARWEGTGGAIALEAWPVKTDEGDLVGAIARLEKPAGAPA